MTDQRADAMKERYVLTCGLCAFLGQYEEKDIYAHKEAGRITFFYIDATGENYRVQRVDNPTLYTRAEELLVAHKLSEGVDEDIA